MSVSTGLGGAAIVTSIGSAIYLNSKVNDVDSRVDELSLKFKKYIIANSEESDNQKTNSLVHEFSEMSKEVIRLRKELASLKLENEKQNKTIESIVSIIKTYGHDVDYVSVKKNDGENHSKVPEYKQKDSFSYSLESRNDDYLDEIIKDAKSMNG